MPAVELTESAQKKLPAALKAKEKRMKAGSLGSAKKRVNRPRSALEAARRAQGIR